MRALNLDPDRSSSVSASCRWYSPIRGARHWFTGPIRNLESSDDGSAASGKALVFENPEYV